MYQHDPSGALPHRRDGCTCFLDVILQPHVARAIVVCAEPRQRHRQRHQPMPVESGDQGAYHHPRDSRPAPGWCRAASVGGWGRSWSIGLGVLKQGRGSKVTRMRVMSPFSTWLQSDGPADNVVSIRTAAA